MNVLNRVTWNNLKKNKTRTIVTIIGVILSAAMITAVTTFVSTMQDYMLRSVLGKGQAILPRIFQQELAELLLRNR